jgi:hypothetical protein
MNFGNIIGLITGGIGALVVLCGIAIAVRTGLNSKSWRQAQATVVGSSIESRTDSEGDTVYFGVYRMRFEAGGQTVISEIRSNPQTSSRKDIEARVAMHPEGSHRAIFFNPNKPSDVMLDFSLSAYAVPIGFLLMGFLFLIVGGMIWYGTQPPEW